MSDTVQATQAFVEPVYRTSYEDSLYRLVLTLEEGLDVRFDVSREVLQQLARSAMGAGLSISAKFPEKPWSEQSE